MPVPEFTKVKLYRGQPVCMIQHKLDGHRVMIQVHGHPDDIEAWTRADVNIWPKLSRVPHIAEAVSRLPAYTHIDCELFAEGIPATSMKTLINECSPHLQVTPFAMPMFKGNDLLRDPMDKDPEQDWKRVADILNQLGFHTPPTRFLGGLKELDDGDVQNYKLEARNAKHEGFVVKAGHLHGWYKIKPTSTVDAVIVDWTKSTSITYYGQIRGIVAAVYDPKTQRQVVVCNTGNGLSARFKEEIEGREKSLIGKVVTIEFDSLAAKGRLKFPRIVTDDRGWPVFREDKSPEECTLEQL